MARDIREVRKVIGAEGHKMHENILMWLRDDENCLFAGHLIELFRENIPTHGLVGTVEYSADSKGITNVADFNNYSVYYPSERQVKDYDLENDWLYVCAGNQRLADVMKEMIINEHLYSNDSDRHHRKNVVLLTTKWSDRSLKANELRFIQSAIDYNVNYHFIVVSDYGLYRVPFLPANLDPRPVDKFRGEDIVLDNGEAQKLF